MESKTNQHYKGAVSQESSSGQNGQNQPGLLPLGKNIRTIPSRPRKRKAAPSWKQICERFQSNFCKVPSTAKEPMFSAPEFLANPMNQIFNNEGHVNPINVTKKVPNKLKHPFSFADPNDSSQNRNQQSQLHFSTSYTPLEAIKYALRQLDPTSHNSYMMTRDVGNPVYPNKKLGYIQPPPPNYNLIYPKIVASTFLKASLPYPAASSSEVQRNCDCYECHPFNSLVFTYLEILEGIKLPENQKLIHFGDFEELKPNHGDRDCRPYAEWRTLYLGELEKRAHIYLEDIQRISAANLCCR